MNRIWAAAALVAALMAGAALGGNTLAVVISVPECRGGRYPLPMARDNAALMQGVLGEGLQLPADHIVTLSGADVTKSAVRALLRDQLPEKLGPDDLLLVYYTGHGTFRMIAGVPVRLYLTFDAAQRAGATGVGDRWEDDTVFTDLELRDWLKPVHAKGAKTLLLRECCFNGGGYSAELQQASLAPAAGNRLDQVATYELSACSFDQAAYATVDGDRTLGVFTLALARGLRSTERVLTLADVARVIDSEVPRIQKLQTPSFGGSEREQFARRVLVDRSRMTLVVRAIDALDGQEILGATVALEGRAALTTPATIVDLNRAVRRVFPWIEQAGYIAEPHQVTLSDTLAVQEVQVLLEPSYAEITGTVHASSGDLSREVRVGFEPTSEIPARTRLFDAEVTPASDGRFTLHVPAGILGRVVVFDAGRLLARRDVSAGEALQPRRAFDRERQQSVAHAPYDVGQLSIDLATAPVAVPPASESKAAFRLADLLLPPRHVEGFTYRGKNPQGRYVYVHQATGMEFLYLYGGKFTMGSPADEASREDDEEQHEVSVSHFLVATTEVTNAVWRKTMGGEAKEGEAEDEPATDMTWHQAQSFCAKLGLALPTEAEWEYACRGFEAGPYAGELNEIAWYFGDSFGMIRSVAKKRPNKYGLYDMHGNVAEWCADWIRTIRRVATDPTGPAIGVQRVCRGGSAWTPRPCRSARRDGIDGRARADVGLRPVKRITD
ncbi:MAG: SUMF1/EgtB/PvdO family nonheme iron enzyme [Planctomycetota bacterium]